MLYLQYFFADFFVTLLNVVYFCKVKGPHNSFAYTWFLIFFGLSFQFYIFSAKSLLFLFHLFKNFCYFQFIFFSNDRNNFLIVNFNRFLFKFIYFISFFIDNRFFPKFSFWILYFIA